MDWNKTQAAIRAGYSKASARYSGYELLKKPHIQKLVREVQRQRAERLDLDSVWLKDQLQDCYAAAREKGDVGAIAVAVVHLGASNPLSHRAGVPSAGPGPWAGEAERYQSSDRVE